MDRAQKEDLVATLHQAFDAMNLLVVTHQSGLTVAEVSQLRRNMRDAGAQYKVTKNRLARRALEGTKFQALQPLFTGPTAIAFSEDPVAAAKVCASFAKKNGKLTTWAARWVEKSSIPGKSPPSPNCPRSTNYAPR